MTTNPPAFPTPEFEHCYEQGMSLRDYFAAKVVQASLSHYQNQLMLGSNQEQQIKNIADDCYKMADAMLKARQS